jgi:hypothetical protein
MFAKLSVENNNKPRITFIKISNLDVKTLCVPCKEKKSLFAPYTDIFKESKLYLNTEKGSYQIYVDFRNNAYCYGIKGMIFGGMPENDRQSMFLILTSKNEIKDTIYLQKSKNFPNISQIPKNKIISGISMNHGRMNGMDGIDGIIL